MIVGGAVLSCCCDQPTLWPECDNPHPFTLSETVYTMSQFDLSVVYMDRFRPANPSDEFDDQVEVFDPDRVPPGCPPPQSSPCQFPRVYTPASFSISAKLTHRRNAPIVYPPPVQQCVDNDVELGNCRLLNDCDFCGNAPNTQTAKVEGSQVDYAVGGTLQSPNIPTNCSGNPRCESFTFFNDRLFIYPSYRIRWGCNQPSTIGGGNYFVQGTLVPHPGFGFYGPRMEVVVIEVGRMGLLTTCDQQGQPITTSLEMIHSTPTCSDYNQTNCCQYGACTILTYWRPLQGDPNAPGFCFTPGSFTLHTVYVPFRCFISAPLSLGVSKKTCVMFAPGNDPRRVYTSAAAACSGWSGPGRGNRSVGHFGLMRWSPALGEDKPDVVNITCPTSITIQ